MTDADKLLIREVAAGRSIHREAAIAAYRTALRAGESRNNPYMLFMSEVDNTVPDLALRATYRRQVLGL